MPRLDKERIAILLVAVVAMAAPILVAAYFARQQSAAEYRTRADRLAKEVLYRAEAISQQIAKAFARLESSGTVPCSDEGIALMRAIALGSDRLAGVAHVEGDQMTCSSFGLHRPAIDVGPADYRSAAMVDIRRQRELVVAPGTQVLLATAASGYTAIVHPARAIAVAERDGTVSLALVGSSTGHILVARGALDEEWLRLNRRAAAPSGIRFGDDYVSAWQVSALWDYTAYAVIGGAEIDRDANRLALLLTPIALLGGCLLFLVGYHTVRRWSSLPALLRSGLRRNEILVHYQPIVDLATGRWVGCEALARWRRAGGEWVSPDIFVPIAERHGLLMQLTTRMAQIAIAEIARLVQRDPDFFVSLNVGASDLLSPDLQTILRDLLERHRLSPRNVHIELTERELADTVPVIEAIANLRSAGFTMAADDFGVGYSNLSYLQTVRLDFLKIDRRFLDGMPMDEPHKQPIAHIIEMAQEHGIGLIAEGIETEEQYRFLRAQGVGFGQGWLFAHAMPIDDLERRLLQAGAGRQQRGTANDRREP
ncbi:MAG: EAL domain-containing protein [Alphaproteobacteria bacterium]